MWSGAYSCLRLPTALAEMIRSTPSNLKPKILAAKFSSDGRNLWPAPCRARNATGLPRRMPTTYGPDGSPKGVFSDTSLRSARSAMSYRPLPPITPICAFMNVLFFGPPRAASPPSAAWPPHSMSARSGNRLDIPLPIPLPNVPRGDVCIVLEEDEVLALDRLAKERTLEVQRVER